MDVKPKRAYDASRRHSRTEERRAGILEVAVRLFGERGIDRVTIDEIAAEAGVSATMVYKSYQSKAGILEAIVARTFFGEEYAELARKIEVTTDPIELLKITAAISRVIFDNEKAQIGLMRGASSFSSDLIRVEKEFEMRRYELQHDRAALMVRTFPTARRMGIAKVRDTMWALTGRDLYRMYVMERGWSSDEYQEWLADALIGILTVER